jgi:hypothetical protein
MYMKCAEIFTELDDACYAGNKALGNILVSRRKRHWVSNDGFDVFKSDQTRAVEERDTPGSVSWDHPSRRDYSDCSRGIASRVLRGADGVANRWLRIPVAV